MSKFTEKQVKNAGIQRMRNILGTIDMPGEGAHAEETEEEFCDRVWEIEENDRQYSPFEFTANELNDLDDDPECEFEPWETFSDGMNQELEENCEALQWPE